jgi:hypothetical protein
MRIPEAAISRLADQVVRAITAPGFIVPKVPEKQLVERVARLIIENLRAEQELEEEAERTAAKLGRQALEIKRALEGQREVEARLDEIVRRKIASLSRKVPPGSREWDILYQRYMDEEHRKQKS